MSNILMRLLLRRDGFDFVGEGVEDDGAVAGGSFAFVVYAHDGVFHPFVVFKLRMT